MSETRPFHNDFDDLPLEVQASIKRRDAVTQPLHEAIQSLDLTWEIVRGSMADLDGALRIWEGPSWRNMHNDAPGKHRYHRQLLRLFHNFLASAVSTVSHAVRIVSGLREVAPRACLRDCAIHTGHLRLFSCYRRCEPTQALMAPCVSMSALCSSIWMPHAAVAAGRKRKSSKSVVSSALCQRKRRCDTFLRSISPKLATSCGGYERRWWMRVLGPVHVR